MMVHLRLKNLEIGYDIDVKPLNVLNIQKLRFHIAGCGLLTLSYLDNIDNERTHYAGRCKGSQSTSIE